MQTEVTSPNRIAPTGAQPREFAVRPTGRLLRVLPCLLAFATAAQAQVPSLLDAQLIALRGDPIPGYEAAGSTHDIGTGSTTAHLGPAGHVAYFVRPFGQARGWLYWNDGTTRNLWFENQPIPAGVDTTRDAFSFALAGIDSDGHIAYQTLLSCPDGGNAGNCTVHANLVGSPLSLTNYVLMSWDDPKSGAGALAINKTGAVAAIGRYFEDNFLREELRVFPTDDPSDADWVVTSGLSVSDDANEDLFADQIRQVKLSETGHAFALVTLEDENKVDIIERVIVTGSSWANQILLARTSTPAPGPPALGSLPWVGFQSFKATTNQRIALQGRVLVNGLWSVTATDQRLVMMPDHTSFIGAQPDEIITSWGTSDYEIGRNGDIVFMAKTNLERDGVFRWQSGSLTALLIEGQPAPSVEGRTVNTVSVFRTNPRGDVVVPGSLNVGGSVLYLFETGETEPRIIVRPGDLYQLGGEQETLSGFQLPTGSVDERTIFNDKGQLAIGLQSISPTKIGLFLLETSRPDDTFSLDGDDAIVVVQTIPGKRLALRRTTDFVNFTDVATGITGDGESIEVRDPGVRLAFDNAYYLVFVEGDA